MALIPVTNDGKKILLYEDQNLVDHLIKNCGYRQPTPSELLEKCIEPKSEPKSKPKAEMLDTKDNQQN
jgi:hypothetical protein